MHLNHQRGDTFRRRRATDYPYSDTGYNQENQARGNIDRRREDKRTAQAEDA